MKMGYGFAAIRTVVDDNAIAVLEVEVGGDAPGGHQKVSEGLLVFGFRASETGNHLSGNDENMGGRLRRNIPDGKADIVFMNNFGGDVPSGYLLKNGWHEEQLEGVRVTVNSALADWINRQPIRPVRGYSFR